MSEVRSVPAAVSAEALAHQWARQEGGPHGASCVVDSEVAARLRNGLEWRPREAVAVATIARPAGLEPVRAELGWLAVSLAGAEAMAALSGELRWCLWPDRVVGEVGPDPSVSVTAASALGPGTVTYVVMVVRVDLEPHPAWARAAVADAAVTSLRAAADMLHTPDELVASYRERCRTLGATVKVRVARGTHRGRAVAIDERGRLVLESPTGMREAIAVGEVGAIEPQ